MLKSYMSSPNWWKKTRVQKGLRKSELARKAGVSSKTIMRLESGDPSITEETKSKIRNALTHK
jgi:transcriptional regulator with XRE-family HTH domain